MSLDRLPTPARGAHEEHDMETRQTPDTSPASSRAARDRRTLTLAAMTRPARSAVPGTPGGRPSVPGDAADGERGGDPNAGARSGPPRAILAAAARTQVAKAAGAAPDRPAIIRPDRPRTSMALPKVTGAAAAENPPAVRDAIVSRRPSWKKRLPIWVAGNLIALLIVGLAMAMPGMTSTATASACDWYTVKPGNTLRDIATAHHSTAASVAEANHISTSAPLYVGQKLCLPTTWWAQASSTPVIPVEADLALPPGIIAGEPCTADRSIVWTGTISQWTVPPGCFGLIYSPNPRDYMVNGQVIPGMGWCNWWPEAMLRDPSALDKPGHSTPRVGVPVFFGPPPGSQVGHYAFVESLGAGPYSGWMLISEMNDYWRGGGWGKVNYRYVRTDFLGAQYLY
jgi:hypothetical protein